MQPFTVAVPDAVLDDLQERLTRSRLPNQIAGIGWGQGTERGFLTALGNALSTRRARCESMRLE